MRLPTARAAAALTILNIKAYAKEKGKAVSRCRMSRQTVFKLTKRTRYHDSFVEGYIEHLDALGWTAFALRDGSYAYIETATAEGWTKISSARIAKEIRAYKKGAMTEDDIELLLELPDDDDGAEEEE